MNQEGSLSSIILASSKSGKHQAYQPLHSMSLPQGQQDVGPSARSCGAPSPLSSPRRLLPVLGKEVPPACCHCWKVSKISSFQVVRANKQLEKYLYFNNGLLEIKKLTSKADIFSIILKLAGNKSCVCVFKHISLFFFSLETNCYTHVLCVYAC